VRNGNDKQLCVHNPAQHLTLRESINHQARKPSVNMASAKRRKTNAEPRFLCTCCDTERKNKQFPDYNPSPDCEHNIHTCKVCLRNWIEARVGSDDLIYLLVDTPEGGKAFGIPCPECKAVMRNVNVEMAVSKKVYQMYVERRRKWVQENTPGWFYCMVPDCEGGHVHVHEPQKARNGQAKKSKKKGGKKDDAEAPNIFVCEECGGKACVPCQRPWHEGESCADYQARIKDRVDEEDESLKMIKKVTKKCPGCKR
jgi:hypothetical protein